MQVLPGKVGLGSCDGVGLHAINQKNYARPKSYGRSIHITGGGQAYRPTPIQSRNLKVKQTYKGFKCGTEHKRAICPAFGKTFKKCGNKNHFAVTYSIICQSNAKPRPIE